MKNLFKKKSIIGLCVALLLIGSTQVYASAALNTDIISLIKAGFQSITQYFLQSSDQEVSKIETDKSNDIKQYIDSSTKKSVTEIETYKNSEVARANREIDTYVKDIKKQLDSAIAEEKAGTKQQITQQINNNIANIKSDLDKDMEQYIKDILKK